MFTSTQLDADWPADRLSEMGHSVAARGLDVPTIGHIISFGLAMKEEDYGHRASRTGRSDRAGLAVTLAEGRDSGVIHHIQRCTAQRIANIDSMEPKPAGRTFSKAGSRPAH